MEESRILRRRKSSGDVVLERNLCFVDSPGVDYRNGNSTSSLGSGSDTDSDALIKYMEENMWHNDSLATYSLPCI